MNDVVLIFPCLQQTVRSALPENWEIPLHFVLPPPEKTVYPLLDLPTPTAAPALPTPPEAEGQVLSPNDISLSFTSLTDFDHPLAGGVGGPGTFGFSYTTGLPNRPILVSVTAISFELAGPWQSNLNLPVNTSAWVAFPRKTYPDCTL